MFVISQGCGIAAQKTFCARHKRFSANFQNFTSPEYHRAAAEPSRSTRCPQAYGTDLGGAKDDPGSGIVSKFWGIKSGCSGIVFQIWAKLEFLKDFTHPKTWSPFRGIVSGFLFQSGQTGVRNVVPRWMWIWPYRLYCCDILVF